MLYTIEYNTTMPEKSIAFSVIAIAHVWTCVFDQLK